LKRILRPIFHGSISLARLMFPRTTDGFLRRRTFKNVYRQNQWGKSPDGKFFSGVGSYGAAADTYVTEISRLIDQHASEFDRPVTVVDLGCGDFSIGSRLVSALPGARYIGCDIVPELIEHHRSVPRGELVSFQAVDIVKQPLPAGDICLIRQVLQHLSNSDIASVLSKLRQYRYVFVTEGQPLSPTGEPNPDQPTGRNVRFDFETGLGRGVELDQPPFNTRLEEIFRFERDDQKSKEAIVTFRIIW
jgi:hypothetical protein